MSLLWRKAWTVGEQVFHFMLKAATGLAQKCGCCPCPIKGWYIATVCPCQGCGNSGPYFIGDSGGNGIPANPDEEPDENITAFVTIEYGPAQEKYPLVALRMWDHNPNDTNSGTVPSVGKARLWATRTEPVGAILLGVRHKCRPAPFDGTATAKVYIDGEQTGHVWGPTPCETDEELHVGKGNGIEGESEETWTLQVNYRFENEGIYNVDLKITFASSGDEPDSAYVCRTTIRVIDPGDELKNEPWVGDIGIVPEYNGFEGRCLIETVHPEIGTAMGAFLKLLKGPFDTKEEAAYVLDRWEAKIRAYAETCSCDISCGERIFGADIVEGPDAEGWYTIVESGAIGDFPSGPSGCDTGYVKYENWTYSLIDPNTPITLRQHYTENPDNPGQWGGGTSGIMPPCSGSWFVQFRIDDPEWEMEKPIGEYVEILGRSYPIEPYVDCVFCKPYLWDYETGTWKTPMGDHCKYFLWPTDGHPSDWDYVSSEAGGPTGIPANSADLADLIESEVV